MIFTDHESRSVLGLKKKYHRLKPKKEALLNLINEAELSEGVYNSNAIENSTLTLRETEKILLDLEISRNIGLREVFEAKNLATVIEYVQTHYNDDISLDTILLLHRMLITNINEKIAGRFRQTGELVRVGTHIAPLPEHVGSLLSTAWVRYVSDDGMHPIERIAQFHLEFETIHPFVDGNGRMGRVLINQQLFQHDYPPVVIRNKDKALYYRCLADYQRNDHAKPFSKFLLANVKESLHKRIAYMEGQQIVPLAKYAHQKKKNVSALLNAARRQTLPAFREKGVWKIGI
jgi:Fic family protein